MGSCAGIFACFGQRKRHGERVLKQLLDDHDKLLSDLLKMPAPKSERSRIISILMKEVQDIATNVPNIEKYIKRQKMCNSDEIGYVRYSRMYIQAYLLKLQTQQEMTIESMLLFVAYSNKELALCMEKNLKYDGMLTAIGSGHPLCQPTEE